MCFYRNVMLEFVFFKEKTSRCLPDLQSWTGRILSSRGGSPVSSHVLEESIHNCPEHSPASLATDERKNKGPEVIAMFGIQSSFGGEPKTAS